MIYLVKAMISELDVKIIERSSELPPLQCNDFFHSTEMFCIVEKTSGMQPFMVIATKEGLVVAHMLATLRRRGALIPPYIFTQGHVYGEGEYVSEENKEEIFGKMLEAITQRLKKKLCLYIEFSFLSQKMFGYRVFRKNNYFPVHWMEIHNSLHSKNPEERLSKKMKERIEAIKEAHLCFQEVEDDKQFQAFYKMLRRFFSLKIRRYLPPALLFYELNKSNHALLFITRHNETIIGACACIYYKNNAHLWYIASKRKSHPKLHPTTATVWGAINHAHQNGCRHIYFMDIGLPYRKNPYREFILRFGGKEVSTYRWFCFSIQWLNRLIGWFFRE